MGTKFGSGSVNNVTLLSRAYDTHTHPHGQTDTHRWERGRQRGRGVHIDRKRQAHRHTGTHIQHRHIYSTDTGTQGKRGKDWMRSSDGSGGDYPVGSPPERLNVSGIVGEGPASELTFVLA